MPENVEPTQDHNFPPRPRTPEPITPRQIHSADQLSGYMGLEAMNTGAYFRALLDAGFHRIEALELCKLQVVERFRAIYTAKPMNPPTQGQR